MMDIPSHLLPQKLRDIAEYCGHDTALLLLEHAGGGVVRPPAPENLSALHPLVEWLGMARAQAFCQAFSGEVIQIPRAQSALRAMRNQQIRNDRREGASLFSLARRYGLTQRQIMSILGDEGNDKQNDLFGFDP